MRLRIRDLREDNDLKQKVLARLLNVRTATYSRYETGNIDIPVISLIRLAEYYRTSIDYLIGITDEPKPYKRTQKKSKLACAYGVLIT